MTLRVGRPSCVTVEITLAVEEVGEVHHGSRVVARSLRAQPLSRMIGNMALEKRYDATPLQVLTDKATRERIRRLSRHTGRSQAQVMRDILEIGIPMYEEMQGLGGLGE